MEVVLGVWRDALLLKTGLPNAVTFPAVASELSVSVDRWQLRSIHTALRSVRQCIADLEANVRPRLAIESMVLLMAESITNPVPMAGDTTVPAMPRTLDEARQMARSRFRDRLSNGEKIGECKCHSEEGEQSMPRGPARGSRECVFSRLRQDLLLQSA